MCLLTITPEPKTKPTTPPNRVITNAKPQPAEPTQPTPLPPHYITCTGTTKDPTNTTTNEPTQKPQQPITEKTRVTEHDLLHLLLASQRDKLIPPQPAPAPSQSQSQSAQRPPLPPLPPPPLRPREEHHYHHYAAAPPAFRRAGRRRSSASSSSGVSVGSFESVRRKVGGLFQRVGILERDREHREWLSEAAAAAAAAAGTGRGRRERSRSRSRSRGPRLVVGVGGVERVPVPDFWGRVRPVRECMREERVRRW